MQTARCELRPATCKRGRVRLQHACTWARTPAPRRVHHMRPITARVVTERPTRKQRRALGSLGGRGGIKLPRAHGSALSTRRPFRVHAARRHAQCKQDQRHGNGTAARHCQQQQTACKCVLRHHPNCLKFRPTLAHSRWMRAGRHFARFVMDPAVAEAVRRGNVVVFFDIEIAGHAAGRIKMELFKSAAPKVREPDAPVLRCPAHARMRVADGGEFPAVLHGRVPVRARACGAGGVRRS